MGKALYLRKDYESSDQLAWGSIFNDPARKACDVHEIIISSSRVEKLDQLDESEEEACWLLAFDRVSKMLRDYAPKGVALMVNDGNDSRQTVNHVHIHVLADESFLSGLLLDEKIEGIRKKFSQHASPEYVSCHRIKVSSLDAHILTLARRRIAREVKELSAFSIFSQSPISSGDATHDARSLIVQGWSKHSPSPYSLTNIIRCMRGGETDSRRVSPWKLFALLQWLRIIKRKTNAD